MNFLKVSHTKVEKRYLFRVSCRCHVCSDDTGKSPELPGDPPPWDVTPNSQDGLSVVWSEPVVAVVQDIEDMLSA